MSDTRPVFNDGYCPRCESIDTRARPDLLTADLWHSQCEDCGHGWDWTEADVEKAAEFEEAFGGGIAASLPITNPKGGVLHMTQKADIASDEAIRCAFRAGYLANGPASPFEMNAKAEIYLNAIRKASADYMVCRICGGDGQETTVCRECAERVEREWAAERENA